MNNNFKIQMIAIQALDKKYGFTPSPQQVKLLESDGEGTEHPCGRAGAVEPPGGARRETEAQQPP